MSDLSVQNAVWANANDVYRYLLNGSWRCVTRSSLCGGVGLTLCPVATMGLGMPGAMGSSPHAGTFTGGMRMPTFPSLPGPALGMYCYNHARVSFLTTAQSGTVLVPLQTRCQVLVLLAS